jgi:hypothetical protein
MTHRHPRPAHRAQAIRYEGAGRDERRAEAAEHAGRYRVTAPIRESAEHEERHADAAAMISPSVTSAAALS